MLVITDLPDLVTALPAAGRARVERLLRIETVTGELLLPETMRAWAARQFGGLDGVERQTIMRVTNTHTWEGALYNPLRKRRPLKLDAQPVEYNPADDLFAQPLLSTSEDVFGRVRGEHCITSSNIARWDGLCAVQIFDEPDVLAFTQARIRDYFRSALRWAGLAHAHDPLARNLIWFWNGGPKGGASIPHAHAQMGLGRGLHYARVEQLRRAALAYRAQHAVDYFEDLRRAHDDLGLGFQAGALRGFVNLAAIRAQDSWVFGRALDDDLADGLHALFRALVDRDGMRAFDIAVYLPPLFDAAEEDWSGFPAIVRVIGRGSPAMRSSDIGAIDLLAHNVIAADPFEVRARIALPS